jgi:hypothetical protein
MIPRELQLHPHALAFPPAIQRQHEQLVARVQYPQILFHPPAMRVLFRQMLLNPIAVGQGAENRQPGFHEHSSRKAGQFDSIILDNWIWVCQRARKVNESHDEFLSVGLCVCGITESQSDL